MLCSLVQTTESSLANDPSAGGGLIEQIIKRYIECNNVAFVFPTKIAAGMWQERALAFHSRAVLPNERFLPWDSFVSFHAAKAEAGKAEISDQVRELYAEDLGKRNVTAAKKGKPLLRSAIPEKFAESSSAFAPWIAGILPHLALYEEKSAQAGKAARLADTEDEDIAFILNDYKAFLERSNLYEPSWCRSFEGGGKKHIIFFYEAIEGFSACDEQLKAARFSGKAAELPSANELSDFTAVSAPCFEDGAAQFEFYGDFREEFRRVALKIEELLMREESCDAIAVSLADVEESESYLTRELETRGIPFHLRFGRPIAETGAGRIFPLILQCKADDFSFSAVKKLLSLKSIAWLNPELASDLIQFGIDNRCLCSWREGEQTVDIWERMLSLAPKNTDFRIKDCYKKLKKNVLELASAKSFAAVRSAWFAFRKDLLDAEKMGFSEGSGKEGKTKESLEIGRCIAELNSLVDIEQSYPELTPSNPFSFFVARLKKTTYVSQSKEGGVSVFKYKDAAASPFKFHFITGATQEDATALHSELKFLRKDKRDELDKDADASLHLFSSYINGAESGASVFFSASQRGVGGYKTVHSAFSDRADKAKKAKEKALSGAPLDGECAGNGWDKGLPDDPLEMEERLEEETPSRAYPVQKKGFEAYSALNWDKAHRFSFLKKGFEGNASAETLLYIKERIAKLQKNALGEVRVSSTDLKDYADCPAAWFFKKALKLDEIDFAPTPDLVDAGERGTLFHKVFEELCKFIKESDGAFLSSHADIYLKKAKEEIIPKAIEESLSHSSPKSPIAEPTRSALAARLNDGAAALINADCDRLDGFTPVIMENDVCFSEGGIEYAGRIDRISKSRSGESIVIVDYKTGGYPSASAYEPVDGKIEEFQMPFYVFLCRNKLKMNVTQAWFFSVKNQKYAPILNLKDETKPFDPNAKPIKSEEDFERTIEAMKAEAVEFAKSVSAASFCAKNVYADTCQECAFRTVCRHNYSVAQD